MKQTTESAAPSGVRVGAVVRRQPKKMAILVATPEAIRELLFLPPGATLIGLRVPFDRPGTLELKIEGAGWDTPEGSVIMTALGGEATRDENGTVKVDWDLPA